MSDRDRLVELAASVRTIRGWTPANSQARKDAETLEVLIESYILRGVPVKRIAMRMGVTYRAVAARLERRAQKAKAHAA